MAGLFSVSMITSLLTSIVAGLVYIPNSSVRFLFVHPCMHICEPYAHSILSGQEKVSDPLELELRIVMICHVGAGNEP